MTTCIGEVRYSMTIVQVLLLTEDGSAGCNVMLAGNIIRSTSGQEAYVPRSVYSQHTSRSRSPDSEGQTGRVVSTTSFFFSREAAHSGRTLKFRPDRLCTGQLQVTAVLSQAGRLATAGRRSDMPANAGRRPSIATFASAWRPPRCPPPTIMTHLARR